MKSLSACNPLARQNYKLLNYVPLCPLVSPAPPWVPLSPLCSLFPLVSPVSPCVPCFPCVPGGPLCPLGKGTFRVHKGNRRRLHAGKAPPESKHTLYFRSKVIKPLHDISISSQKSLNTFCFPPSTWLKESQVSVFKFTNPWECASKIQISFPKIII